MDIVDTEYFSFVEVLADSVGMGYGYVWMLYFYFLVV